MAAINGQPEYEDLHPIMLSLYDLFFDKFLPDRYIIFFFLREIRIARMGFNLMAFLLIVSLIYVIYTLIALLYLIMFQK